MGASRQYSSYSFLELVSASGSGTDAMVEDTQESDAWSSSIWGTWALGFLGVRVFPLALSA